MRITGHKKLMKQFKDLPKETHEALEKSIARTVKAGANKARAIVPVESGDLKAGINHHTDKSQDRILGFINFFDDPAEGIAANAINYGWPKEENRHGYNFRLFVRDMIAERHKRTVKRNIDKAIREAMKNG